MSVSQRPILDNSLDNSRGPWSGDSVSRLKLHGSRLLDAEPGVTWAGCSVWSEFGRGVEHMFGFFSHWALAVLDGWRRRNKNLIGYAAAVGKYE